MRNGRAKYSLLRNAWENGKDMQTSGWQSDHKHLDEIEVPYIFSNLDTLQADFWTAVNKRRKRK